MALIEFDSTTVPASPENVNHNFNELEKNINELLKQFEEIKEITTYSSTKETIAGEWFGKTLYKKTYTWENSSGSSSKTFLENVSISDLNADIVFVDLGNSYITDPARSYNVPAVNIGLVNNSYEWQTFADSNHIYVNGYNGKRYITIKYTKKEN